MTEEHPASSDAAHAAQDERVPLPVLAAEPAAGEQPIAWWEWPLVVLALPLVFVRSAWRWSARQLQRFAAWLARALAAPLRWLRSLLRVTFAPVRWLARLLSAPARWLARLLSAPARWLNRRLIALREWLARIPAWWWNVLSSIYWWARPGIDVPYQLVVRIAELVVRGAACAARWATAPARRLWSATRAVAAPALARAAQALRRLGSALAAPVRFVSRVVSATAHRLAWPVRAGARVAQRGLRHLVEPWQRVRRRWHAIGARLAATRGRIAARLSRRRAEPIDGESRS